MRRLSFLFVALLVAAPALRAQSTLRDERGSRDAERRTVLDANAVGLTVFNTGLSGGVGEVRGNWPLGSDDFYVGDLLFVVGAEVTDDAGARRPILSVPRGPGNRGIPFNPADPSEAWTWEAVPGYAAAGPRPDTGEPETRPATSTAPETWPAAWPDRAGDANDPGWAGAWDGLLGKNRFVDGQEVYSHLADDHVRTADYTPDPADPSRGGLGLVTRQRVVALRDAGLADAVLYVWDVANASPRTLAGVRAGAIIGTMPGGDGDSQDDIAGLDAARGLVYTSDADGIGNSGQPVGLVGIVWLPTPGAAGPAVALHTARYVAPSNALPLSDAPAVWAAMESGEQVPGDSGCAPAGCDGDVFVSTTAFDLPAFATQRVAAALVFGATLADLQRQADALRALAAGGFAFDDALVTLTASPFPGGADVSWGATDPGARVRLDRTADGGQTWTLVVDALPASGTQTLTLPGAGAYRVRATALGASGAGRAETGWILFGDAAPVATLRVPPGRADGVVEVGYDVAGGRPPFQIALYDRLPGGDTYVRVGEVTATGNTATGTIAWDTRQAPNGVHRLRLAVTDAGFGIGTRESDPLLVDNARPAPEAPGTYDGLGDATVEVRAAQPESITGHAYRVDFAGGPERAGTYTVTDATTGALALGATPLPAGPSEGPLFDGLRLVVRNATPAVDSVFWAGADDPYAMSATEPRVVTWNLNGRLLPYDYRIAFSDAETTLSLGGFRVGTTPLAPTAVARLTNVTVVNATLGRTTPFVFLDRDASGTGTFSATDGGASDNVIVYECLRAVDDCAQAERVPTLFLRAQPVPGSPPTFPGRPPTLGDTLAVDLTKAIQHGDTFRFEARFVVGAEAAPDALFTLGLPVPNPARARTTLRFSLARPAAVRLRVFDLLGREVAVLVDGEQGAGAHEIAVDTRRLSAGLYVARLDAAGASATRRFVVVR